MNAVANYFSSLSENVGRGWNRFWFTPTDALPVCTLRIFAGLAALYFHLSHTADLVRWFGSHGLLPIDTVKRLTGAADGQQSVFRYSYLYLTEAPELLWILHLLGFLVLAMFTVGLFTRLSAILSLVVVLSYIHRAPMITSQFEPVLTMMMFYLCLAPAGAYYSVDRLLKRRYGAGDWTFSSLLFADVPRRAEASGSSPGEPAAPIASTSATVSLRLIQVHLAGLYLMMGLSKLGGQTWWMGEAVWWLMAHTESRLVDFTFLHRATYLINAWTHAIVLFELSFAILIWNRLARPLLLGLGVLMWGSLALVTGLVSFCAIMLVANLAFASPEAMRSGWDACRRQFHKAPAAKETGDAKQAAREPAAV